MLCKHLPWPVDLVAGGCSARRQGAGYGCGYWRLHWPSEWYVAPPAGGMLLIPALDLAAGASRRCDAASFGTCATSHALCQKPARGGACVDLGMGPGPHSLLGASVAIPWPVAQRMRKAAKCSAHRGHVGAHMGGVSDPCAMLFSVPAVPPTSE